MSSLAKPALRGHIHRKGIKLIVSAVLIGVTNATLFKFIVADGRDKAYHDFIKNYDADAHLEELKKYGVLQSAKFLQEKNG